MTTQPTTATTEIAAMTRIVKAMDPLDAATQDRITRWLYDRYATVVEDPDSYTDTGERAAAVFHG